MLFFLVSGFSADPQPPAPGSTDQLGPEVGTSHTEDTQPSRASFPSASRTHHWGLDVTAVAGKLVVLVSDIGRRRV